MKKAPDVPASEAQKISPYNLANMHILSERMQGNYLSNGLLNLPNLCKKIATQTNCCTTL